MCWGLTLAQGTYKGHEHGYVHTYIAHRGGVAPTYHKPKSGPAQLRERKTPGPPLHLGHQGVSDYPFVSPIKSVLFQAASDTMGDERGGTAPNKSTGRVRITWLQDRVDSLMAMVGRLDPTLRGGDREEELLKEWTQQFPDLPSTGSALMARARREQQRRQTGGRPEPPAAQQVSMALGK